MNLRGRITSMALRLLPAALLPPALSSIACRSDGNDASEAADTLRSAARVTQLPGAVWTLEGDTLDPSTEPYVLLYTWIPMPDYPQEERDLMQLDSISALGGVLVVPVQLDSVSRHIAQYGLQAAGSDLQVCLGDGSLACFFFDSCRGMPVALLAHGPDIRAETGHGAAMRLVRSCPALDSLFVEAARDTVAAQPQDDPLLPE
ncbi:hypothetical protein JW921_05040 [Candidatus Fermentibacterales bacterium]|nr:hypothetical protein [Candidatus Fermentibacterales bacterium]